MPRIEPWRGAILLTPTPLARTPLRRGKLAAFSQRELGESKAPKVIKLVDDLPKGPSGKVQRLKLVEA